MPSGSRTNEKPQQSFKKVEADRDLVSDLDMTSAIEAESNAEIMAAPDVADDRSASVVAANEVTETADDMLADLDMTPALEAESDEEIMRALDSEDDDTPDHPLPVTPVADWLTDVQELARKHGPFAPWQIVQVIRALNATEDPAIEAGR